MIKSMSENVLNMFLVSMLLVLCLFAVLRRADSGTESFEGEANVTCVVYRIFLFIRNGPRLSDRLVADCPSHIRRSVLMSCGCLSCAR